jgi:hypothetical protein
MPRSEQLPETLRELAFRHAVRIDTGQDFDQHMGRFIHHLNEIIESRTHLHESEAIRAVLAGVLPGEVSEAEPDAVEPGARRSAVTRTLAASLTGPLKSSRPVILVGIGLLVLLVVAGIGFVTQQRSARQEPVSLKVSAKDDVGTVFQNTTKRLENVAFNAKEAYPVVPGFSTFSV